MTLRGEDITGPEGPHRWSATGVGYVPQTNNVFPRLTVEENLEMGLYQRPQDFAERFDVVTELFPLLGERRSSGPARCRAASARWWPWAGR